MPPEAPREKYSRAVVYKINQKKMTVEQVLQYGKERCSDWYSPVTSLTEYQADKDSIVVYAAFAGAPRDEKTGKSKSRPNPCLEEFRWGETTPAVEIRLKNTMGYQAFPVSLKKKSSQENNGNLYAGSSKRSGVSDGSSGLATVSPRSRIPRRGSSMCDKSAAAAAFISAASVQGVV